MRGWIGLLVGILALALLAGCGPRRSAQSEPRNAGEALASQVKVRVVEAKSGRLTISRTTGATLAPARESQVGATAAGKVLSVLVEEGSRVAAGQVVLRLDPENAQTALRNAEIALEQARVNLARAERSTAGSLAPLQASLESALANLRAAEQRYQEGKQLFAAGAIAQVELVGLEATYNQAKAAADNARENLARAQRASQEDLALLRLQVRQAENQLAQAKRALADTEVRAPFAGVVAEVYVNPGEFVAAGQRVFRLADTRRLEARFRLPPEDAAALPLGSLLNLSYGEQTYTARLIRSSQVPGTDRLVELTAQVEGSPPLGVSVQVRYTLTLAEGILLPAGALRTEGRTTFVYLVQGERAVRTPVRVVGDSGAQVVVEGVRAGAQVVFPVPSSLSDGDRVEVVR
ncbi:Multidrug resistance protein MdtA [Meiothermus luteus]|uniref:Multidrug resistance protein MdtA n=1 Tax=Meiothermus luteus TaxID=2026184 RepID=A0A399EEW0_9DEIN|nr:efflux RND transporter periplasmic adaptor subunit [Meiothermus luteus]RIH83157.1 Multidrug resistance protein MdtA [Meiothermus luteus]RMH55234.1 MAG: efflux RND transporter periplasmic adaptor subunit [Deinococcota bacterium]